jgi:DNA-binding SARP family transcriptional activator
MVITRRQARAIVFILATNIRPTSRDTICDLLWEEHSYSDARRNLTRLLTQLRTLLPRHSMIQSNNDKIWLDLDQVHSGTEIFENFRRSLSSREHLEVCRQVADLYHGPFLDGFYLPAAPNFENWLEIQRRYLEETYLRALDELVEQHASDGRVDHAIHLAQRYLWINELDERIQRRLIELLAMSGNRLGAKRQFERYAELLRTELNDSPRPELVDAYHTILLDSVV